MAEMQYNVAGLLKEGIGARRNFAFENEKITTPGENFREVAGVVRLLRTDKGILAQAEVHGLTSDQCSRCLGNTMVEVEVYLEEEFYPTNYFEGFTERDEGKGDGFDDPALLINEDNILDLREPVRQNFVSAIPLAPLCRDGCKGICPTCSIDLNKAGCKCSPEQEVPEWAKSLRSLGIK